MVVSRSNASSEGVIQSFFRILFICAWRVEALVGGWRTVR